MAAVELAYKTDMPAKHSLLRIPGRLQRDDKSSCDRYQQLLAQSPEMAGQMRAIEFIDLQPECVPAAANLICTCTRLEYVSFKGYPKKDANQLSVGNVEQLMATAIRRTAGTNAPPVGPLYVGFPDHRIGHKGFEKILNFMHMGQFKGLDFTRMQLGEESLCTIASFLQNAGSAQLEELHLRGNEDAFTPVGRAALHNALSINQTLKVLNVADTQLGADMAGIIKVTHVKELNVARNVCDESANLDDLFEAIQNNTSIEKLVMNGVLGDINENARVVVDRWQKLVVAVRNNKTLQQIITQDPDDDDEDVDDKHVEVGSPKAIVNECIVTLNALLQRNREAQGSPKAKVAPPAGSPTTVPK